MKFSAGVKVVFAFILVCAIIDVSQGSFIGKCWDAWSRCTRWSYFATGIGWQSCQDRCFCLGHRTGTCVEVPSQCPLTKMAWQCQCSGSSGGAKKPRWCGF
ncbi:hydramacin-1-like [Acropora palmata]|uniref:hydramacin-1-like n=1 Tax=Acropora palmata TaxID=6131 RepID=UPI003DA016FD